MDEVFSIFLETFGGPVDRQEVPASSIERYRGKLPSQLLEYWGGNTAGAVTVMAFLDSESSRIRGGGGVVD